MAAITDELREIKKLIQDWKLSQPGKTRPRYPNEIKFKIAKAAEKHGLRYLSQTFNISRNMIKAWLNDKVLMTSAISEEKIDFVEMANLKMPVLERIELILPSGIVIRITSDVPPLFVARLCKALVSPSV